MSSWESERRLDFIEDRLIANGRFNRAELVEHFGTSIPQSSVDLRRYCEQNPRVVYDRNMKAYRWTDDGKSPTPVRGSTPARRKAWSTFARIADA